MARSPSTWPAAAAEAPGIYRPRHPERTSFYRIFEQHFCEYVGTYEERFEYRSGPLRKIVVSTVEAYLDFGWLVNGFARIRCPQCGSEHLLAFSCQTRNFCPSCQSKRATLFAERVSEEIALPVVHPHIHALATQGALRSTGEFVEVGTINTDVLEQLFRRLVLIRLHRAERLSAEFRDTLLAWTHSGFSVHAGPRIYPWEAGHLARLGRYIARVPMPQKEVRLTEAGKVRISTPPDPRTGGTELELDPLDWIHQVVQQIPAPRQHLTRYYGAYANRRRRKLHAAWSAAAEGERRAAEAQPASQNAHPLEPPNAAAASPAPSVPTEQTLPTPPEDPIPLPPCRSSWARLLRKIFEVDPLLCPQCQRGRVTVVRGLPCDLRAGRPDAGCGANPDHSLKAFPASPAGTSPWGGGRSYAWSGPRDRALLAHVTEEERPGDRIPGFCY